MVKEWLDNYLDCRGGTYPAQLMYQSLADMACNRITAAITSREGERSIKALLDSYNPTGSTRRVNFTTAKTGLWTTDPRKCHINLAVLDSDWESEFCRVVESHPAVMAYVKNHNLGLEVPYLYGSVPRKYIPDFIVQVGRTGVVTRSTSLSKSRDTGVRTPRKRRTRWRPTGCPA